MSVIVTDHLIKSYGSFRALRGVSLDVREGEIFGLLGQNGAGKTTLIKILLGILNLTDGKARVLGEPVGTIAVRRRIGYLPEDHRFPEYHTAVSLLDLYGALLDVPAAKRRSRSMEVLVDVGLKDRMHHKIRTYSKGMKQRLGLAQAMMHEPEVIFLDEPTDGVDPVGRREIREMLQRLKANGTTVFINSHLLGEVELVCDRVAILDRGEVIRQGDVQSLTRMRGTFRVGLAPGQEFPAEAIRGKGYSVTQADPVFGQPVYEIILDDGQMIDPVVAHLHASGLNVRHLVEQRQTLEDLFVATVDEGRERRRERAPRPRATGASDAITAEEV